MADNVTVDNGTGTDYGVATDKVTYSGDADQSVQLFRPVHVTGAEGSRTVTDITGDGGLFVQGAIAHDVADSGNPVKIGGRASSTVPAAVTSGDRVNAWYGANGQQAAMITGDTGTWANVGLPADSFTNMNALVTVGKNHLFNGTGWDRARNLPAFDTAVAAPVRLGVQAVAQPDYRYTSVSLATAASSTQAWDTNGVDQVLIHVGTSTTGTFIFEVTGDGSNWVSAETRDTQLDTWVSATNLTPTANKTYRIVSNGWRQVRARTVTTLGATVALTANLAARSTVLNAIDSGPAPHAFGYTPWNAAADITTATTTNIKTPTSGRRLVLTSLSLGTAGTTAGLVTVWYAASADTTINVGTDIMIFRGNLTPTANATPGVVMNWPTNPPIGATDHLLKVTTGAATTLYVAAFGYEIV